MGLKTLTITPMLEHDDEEKAEPKDMKESDEDGLRESFDEFLSAMDAKDDDAAFEALKNFTDMCAMKSTKDGY
jgi:hypothetical protein